MIEIIGGLIATAMFLTMLILLGYMQEIRALIVKMEEKQSKSDLQFQETQPMQDVEKLQQKSVYKTENLR